MARYIDADKFGLFIYTDTEGRPDTFDDGVMFVLDKIDAAPTADVAPIIHAHWERKEDYVGTYHACSNCHSRCPTVMTVLSTVYNPYGEEKEIELSDIIYCPSCGAIMDEEVE